MEQEHMIIIALLVVALYFLMMRKPCACPSPSQGFNIERFRESAGQGEGIVAGGSGTIARPLWIRKRQDEDLYKNIQNRIQNRNHNMYQSQYVKHHLKADHRGKMLRNMMGGCGDDPANCAVSY